MEKTLQTLKELYPDEDIYGLLCLKKDKDLTILKNVILKNLRPFYFEDKKAFCLNLLF